MPPEPFSGSSEEANHASSWDGGLRSMKAIVTANAERLLWRARRLRAMSAGELAARLPRSARHRVDDLAWRYARPVWQRGWILREKTGSISNSPAGPLTTGRAAEAAESHGEELERVIRAAIDVMKGRMQLLGYPAVQLGVPFSYSVDPFTELEWPPVHAKRLDYRRAEFGDPKWIWELNRCQFLPVLVQAWLVTGDNRFAARATEEMLNWIAQNLPGRGIAWSNGFEAGIRAISMATAFDALRPFEGLGTEQRRIVLQSLWQHGRWIERDPSTHSSANNHRIGELASLVAIGVLAPELRAAKRWIRIGIDGLGVELNRQILPDGTSAEQAFSYHMFVVDLALFVIALLGTAGHKVPASLLDPVRRAGHALWAQIDDNEPPLNYGDSDDGRAIRLDGEPFRNPRDVAAGIAACLGDSFARRVASRLDLTAWWLFGANGAERFASTEDAPPPGDALLPDSGLAVLRDGATRTTVDVGTLGYLSIAAHGHADNLHVTVVDRGEELIVDPGTGSYFGHPQWRAAFRGTEFHSTVCVDERDQSEPGGPFLWSSHARTRVALIELERGLVVAEHDGYQRLDDPVRHRRAVIALGDGLVAVYDHLEARARHRYAQSWPLHPSLQVQCVQSSQSTGSAEIARAGELRLILAFAASADGVLEAFTGSERPFAGWWSSRLESVIPSPLCRWTSEVEGPFEIATVLVSAREASWPQVRLSFEGMGDTRSLAIEVGGICRRVPLGFDSPQLA
jgi:Heparinase II/III-like protein/Heparinase II/III N-terminus